MKTYSITFNGRQTGAIGIFYEISETYKAKNLGQFMTMLLTDYEHI